MINVRYQMSITMSKHIINTQYVRSDDTHSDRTAGYIDRI